MSRWRQLHTDEGGKIDFWVIPQSGHLTLQAPSRTP